MARKFGNRKHWARCQKSVNKRHEIRTKLEKDWHNPKLWEQLLQTFRLGESRGASDLLVYGHRESDLDKGAGQLHSLGHDHCKDCGACFIAFSKELHKCAVKAEMQAAGSSYPDRTVGSDSQKRAADKRVG